MVTLKDIALAQKVSITTVSRVLSNDKTLKVHPDTRKRIIDYAEHINYTPRRKKQAQRLIGIVTWLNKTEELKDPYFMEIRHGIERLAEDSHIFLMTLYKDNGGYDLSKLSGVDGLICIGRFTKAEESAFLRTSKQLVFVDTSPDPLRFDSVIIDYQKSVQFVIEYLINQQYASIGFIGGVESGERERLLGEHRERHTRQYLFERNMLDTQHFHINGFSVESGYDAMRDILTKKDRARAYFCASDSIATGAMKAIHEAGLSIPHEIAIVGFNDIAQSAYLHPSLTTLKVHTGAMGEEALQSLMNRLDNPRRLPVKKIIPTQLVKRQSA